MATRSNPAVIGAFVIGAITIALGAILILGAGRLFSKQRQFVSYFTGSVNGLRIGSPVKFRGVEIGTVTDIRISLSKGRGARPSLSAGIPVIYEIDETRILRRGGGEIGGDVWRLAMERGLRAQLATESLLTGLLYIDIDFHPGSPLNLVLPRNSQYTEIPTLPTVFQQVQQKASEIVDKLSDVDFAALVKALADTIGEVHALVGNPRLKKALETLDETTRNLNLALQSIRKAADHLDTRVDPLVASLRKTSDETQAALVQAKDTLNAVQATIEPDSPLNYQLAKTLEELRLATRSMRELTDYLQRNPSSILRGKPTPAEDHK